MQDTLQLFCPMNESGRALTNGSALFLGRIAHSDGRPVVPSEIDTVFYTIFRLDDSDASVRIPIEGHTETEIDPEEILLSETILDENWVFDEEGYNFRYALDDSSFSPFPVSGRNYLVSFELKPGDSSPKIRVQYRVRVC